MTRRRKTISNSPGSTDISFAPLAECLLRRVDYIQEAVLVSLVVVDFADGSCVGDHAVVIHKEEERLVGV